jgi:tRNA:m4X modification enzyme
MEAINQNEYANIPTKQIVYKGKTKEIPAYNADPKLCENYIIARHRYCKFEKHLNSQFCIYHMPKENEDNVEFIVCPIDPSHRVLADKFQRHIKVCNKIGEKQRLINNVWYSEKKNKVNNEESINKNLQKLQEISLEPSSQNLSSLYDLRWEDLSEEEMSSTIDKIVNCYEILKEDYKKYAEQENLEHILNEKLINKSKLVSKEEDPDSDFKMFLSAMQINPEKDFDFTTDLPKSEKNGRQNKSITNVMKIFDLLDNKNIFIEFGAGKGGLSYYINTLNNDNSIHILLEREGVRYKKDKYCEGLIRV